MNLAERFRPFSFGSSSQDEDRSAARGSSVGERALDEALKVYSKPILDVLESATDHQIPLVSLAERVDEQGVCVDSYDQFVGTIRRLADLKLVEIIPAKFGRDIVKLVK